MYRLSFLLFLGFIASFSSEGQEVLETNPSSVKWMRLTSPHFKVLYPVGYDRQAQRTAGTLETLYEPESKTLGTRPRRTTIVLQGLSSESNAFVSITPRRSEFYMMPSQDYNFVGNNEWMEMIASHEFRHIVQFDHADQGFNRFVHVLFGNATLAALANTAVPSWFWEGDAVATETAYLPYGRGKIPNFGLLFRTNLLEGRTFNYHKQWLRSYKHNIPNHYVLGYHMVSYLRKRTGDPEIWGKITEQAWKQSILPFTFSNAIRKQTGLHVTELYNEMADELAKEWLAWADTLTLTAGEQINARVSDAYTDYLYPHELPDGSVIALKEGIGDIEQLCAFRELDEDKVHVLGVVNQTGMIDVKGSFVAWNEYRYDPRWLARNYSVIKIMDTQTGKRWTVGGPKTRYAGAGISPDGRRVATVHTDEQFNHSLMVLNVPGGDELFRLRNASNATYSLPRFTEDGRYVVALKVDRAGKSVVLIDPADGSEQVLVPPGNENIGYPVVYKSWLLFNAPGSGIDNVHAIHLETGERFQVTNSRYGSYNPSVSRDGTFIYYNDQSRNGLDVERIAFDPAAWRPYLPKGQQGMLLAETITTQEPAVELPSIAEGPVYPTGKYNKLSGVFNPYGWGPLYVNSLSQVDIGISSRDVLSTTSIRAGYLFDIYERTGEWHADVSYQALYPILRTGVTYGSRTDQNVIFGSEVDFEWTETGAYGGVQLPFVLTRGKYLTQLEITNDVGVTLTSGFKSTLTTLNGDITYGDDRIVTVPVNDTLNLSYIFQDVTSYGRLMYNHFGFSFSHALKKSRRDFLPAYAQYVLFDSYSTPFGGDYQGWLWALRGFAYFPGVAKHHSLSLRASYQQSYEAPEMDIYSFRNRIAKPRGYNYPSQSEFVSLSGNYALPVWYPDIAIGPLVNIQRFKANLFYDYGLGYGKLYLYDFPNEDTYLIDNNDRYQSAGIELTADVNLFRLLPQFEFGFRVTRTIPPDGSPGQWVREFLIGSIPF